jgi:hypothetical protein
MLPSSKRSTSHVSFVGFFSFGLVCQYARFIGTSHPPQHLGTAGGVLNVDLGPSGARQML